jgi:hypothetical protein
MRRQDIALLVIAILITLIFSFWSGTLTCS